MQSQAEFRGARLLRWLPVGYQILQAVLQTNNAQTKRGPKGPQFTCLSGLGRSATQVEAETFFADRNATSVIVAVVVMVTVVVAVTVAPVAVTMPMAMTMATNDLATA